MIPSIRSLNSDFIGVFASTLCAVHCMATPLLFVVQSCTSTCCAHESSPLWWSIIDYVFIVITLFAVYFSSKSAEQSWIKWALYSSWAILTFLIVNEKVDGFEISHSWKYVAAGVLISIHLYNRRRTHCSHQGCEHS